MLWAHRVVSIRCLSQAAAPVVPLCIIARWCDPGLTPRGEREVEHAARLLLEGGYKIDVVHKSMYLYFR